MSVAGANAALATPEDFAYSNSDDDSIGDESEAESIGANEETVYERHSSWSEDDTILSARQAINVAHEAGGFNNTKLEVDDAPVTWRSLPHKRQLAILTIARLSEPLVATSLQAYMFYQLKSFDPSLSDAVIASQAGMLASTFTGAQFLTAIMWGRISDSHWGGRKTVLVVGLLGSLISCIGFGFSTTFAQAITFRILGGALNGNIGVMRTMVSEIIQEKKYQSRAFLLFPMCFNIGVIIGPILGGLLADPAGSYPAIFGGIQWLIRFPYAAPNLLSAVFLLASALAVFFGLEETLQSLRHKEDFGSKCGRKLSMIFCRWRANYSAQPHAYHQVSGDDMSSRVNDSEDAEMSPFIRNLKRERIPPRFREKLPFRRIFTYNVTTTFIAHSLLACHLGSFNSLWFIFLSTPVYDPAHPQPPNYHPQLPFRFTGGLGMPPRDVGLAMAILGCIGISMQLFVYPWVNAKIGTIKSWRIFLYFFPVAYILVPYLAVVPSSSPPPAERDGILVWLSLCGVLFIQVVGRTFALPATTILVNNCSPHPSVLGTVHGIGQSAASAARAIGPSLGGVIYGIGLDHGVVGAVFWGLSGIAMLNCLASNFVREGDGHEIELPGDCEAEAEFQADFARRNAVEA